MTKPFKPSFFTISFWDEMIEPVFADGPVVVGFENIAANIVDIGDVLVLVKQNKYRL
jgi:hypothetical protein